MSGQERIRRFAGTVTGIVTEHHNRGIVDHAGAGGRNTKAEIDRGEPRGRLSWSNPSDAIRSARTSKNAVDSSRRPGRNLPRAPKGSGPVGNLRSGRHSKRSHLPG